jgi:hypothetical protein
MSTRTAVGGADRATSVACGLGHGVHDRLHAGYQGGMSALSVPGPSRLMTAAAPVTAWRTPSVSSSPPVITVSPGCAFSSRARLSRSVSVPTAAHYDVMTLNRYPSRPCRSLSASEPFLVRGVRPGLPRGPSADRRICATSQRQRPVSPLQRRGVRGCGRGACTRRPGPRDLRARARRCRVDVGAHRRLTTAPTDIGATPATRGSPHPPRPETPRGPATRVRDGASGMCGAGYFTSQLPRAIGQPSSTTGPASLGRGVE